MQNTLNAKKTFVQIVVSYSKGDGIGNIISSFHDIAIANGHKSVIFSLTGDKSTTFDIDQITLKLQGFALEKPIVIYHYGSPNKTLDTFFTNLANSEKIFYYHNVTPDRFFWPWDPLVAIQLKENKKIIHSLLEKDTWKITADSHFNFEDIPSFSNLKKLKPTIPAKILAERKKFSDLSINYSRCESPVINLVFVGRFAPNKRQEILIYLLCRLVQDGYPVRLILAGKGIGLYKQYIKRLLDIYRVHSQVIIREDATDKDIESIFSMATYTVISSEHEGFCLPLFESLYRGILPICRPFGSLKEYLTDTTACAKNESVESFIEAAINTIKTTWKQKNNYQEQLLHLIDHTDKQFNTYQTTETLIEQLTLAEQRR